MCVWCSVFLSYWHSSIIWSFWVWCQWKGNEYITLLPFIRYLGFRLSILLHFHPWVYVFPSWCLSISDPRCALETCLICVASLCPPIPLPLVFDHVCCVTSVSAAAALLQLLSPSSSIGQYRLLFSAACPLANFLKCVLEWSFFLKTSSSCIM